MSPIAQLSVCLVDRKNFFIILGVTMWFAWGVSLCLGNGHFDVAGQMVGVDHLTFYSTAKLHADGRIDEIYDLEKLAIYQNEISGPGWNSLEAFRAPPFSMLPYRLTSGFSYLTSFWIWTAFSTMLMLGIAFLVNLQPMKLGLIWCLSFHPVFATISFGQNSLISLAILTSVYTLLKSDKRFSAGVIASLLFYKPQLLIGLSLWWTFQVRREPRPLMGLALGGSSLLYFSLTTLRQECEQYMTNIETLLNYDRFNIWNMHNGRAFVVMLFDLPADASRAAGIVILIFGAKGWALLTWREQTSDLTNIDLNMARSIVFTLLFSPHTMIYEWALVLLPVASLLKSSLKHEIRFIGMCLLAHLALSISTPIAKSMAKLSPHMLQLSVPILAWVAWTWLVRNTEWSRTEENWASL